MAGPSESPIRPVLRLTSFVAGVVFVIVLLQLMLNAPARRPYVACWPVYLTAKFFSVTLVKVIFHKEHIFVLENVGRTERLYGSCVDMASKIPGFSGPETADGPFARLLPESSPNAEPVNNGDQSSGQ